MHKRITISNLTRCIKIEIHSSIINKRVNPYSMCDEKRQKSQVTVVINFSRIPLQPDSLQESR